MSKLLSVVISAAILMGAAGKVCAQTDSVQVTAERYREDIEAVVNRMAETGAASPEPIPSRLPMLPRFLTLKPDIGDNGEWDVDRPLTEYEILARDRQLILTRMILEDPTPEFLKDIQRNPSLGAQILNLLLGLLNIGAPLGNMDMLVTPVHVGGKPLFDDMIFLDSNFDPRIYQPSRPVPQYDPLDPSKPYKASVREFGSSSKTKDKVSEPPPVQQSRYIIP